MKLSKRSSGPKHPFLGSRCPHWSNRQATLPHFSTCSGTIYHYEEGVTAFRLIPRTHQ